MATAAVNVALPAIVVQHLTGASFSVWSLALQIAAWVNLLSLGLQTATARAISHASDESTDNDSKLLSILLAARSISHAAAGVALLLVIALVAAYPLLFPSVSPTMVGDFRATLALFGFP